MKQAQNTAPARPIITWKNCPARVAARTAVVAMLSLKESMAVAIMAEELSFFPQTVIIQGHVEFYRNGNTQDCQDQGTGVHRSGVQNLLYGGFAQFEAHQQNQHRYRQTGEVFKASMAEGMVDIRLLAGPDESPAASRRNCLHRRGY